MKTFSRCSARLCAALTDHICDLLARGHLVVLDFPGNTRGQRDWFRALILRTSCAPEMHFIDAPDALCKAQLRERSRGFADGAAWTTEAEFDSITRFFEPPGEEGGVQHRPSRAIVGPTRRFARVAARARESGHLFDPEHARAAESPASVMPPTAVASEGSLSRAAAARSLCPQTVPA